MSETSSDAESSCGWTIISNEGSDIETLGSEAAVEYGAELLERPPVEGAQLQDTRVSLSAAEHVEEKVPDSLDDTVGEKTIEETLSASEAGDNTPGKEHVTVLSCSDHSDIVTLGDLKEDEERAEVEEETAANEEFYLGTSCSSQYAFTTAETVYPVQQPAATHSSSSEDEEELSTSTVVRRRRLRRNTTSVVTEPEEGEEVQESGQSEEEEEEVKEQKKQEMQEEVGSIAAPCVRRQIPNSSILNKCIVIALIVAVSMGVGHFYGTVQIQERWKPVDRYDEELVHHCAHDEFILEEEPDQEDNDDGFSKLVDLNSLINLDKQRVISQLTDLIKKMNKDNHVLYDKLVVYDLQKHNLEVSLREKVEEQSNIVSQQQKLRAENQLLKSSLEHEDKSLSSLQEEVSSLRSKIRDQEAMAADADLLLSENQRLKDELEQEKRLSQSFHVQREDLMAEAHTLRKKIEKEKKVTDELRRELNLLRSQVHQDEKEPETEELQSRLTELEKRLSFEQQRSDLWERLYVETKDERAKGDTESRVKKPKQGMAGKVKETFDAVKNSTKEFVHHHKEQIKKAKEAVKENLRKFSDSVKLTFRNIKHSASSFINNARGFYDKRRDEKNLKGSWQQRSGRPQHRHSQDYDDFSHSSYNTRKPGEKVHEDRGQSSHRTNVKGCSGVFDCAYRESISLFNKATEPIRADEFSQLMQSYLQQEFDHFHHWKELETFINRFFHNGVFIHDRMLFTDFVSGVEDYLNGMREYHGLDDGIFGDLDDYVYRHFFGEAYTKSHGPHGPFERPDADPKESSRARHHQRKQQRTRSRPHERKFSRCRRNQERHMADVKIELGPMPFDPKY